MISGPEGSYEEVCSFRWKPLESGKHADNIINKEDFLKLISLHNSHTSQFSKIH
jgi:hypothetical protein